MFAKLSSMEMKPRTLTIEFHNQQELDEFFGMISCNEIHNALPTIKTLWVETSRQFKKESDEYMQSVHKVYDRFKERYRNFPEG